MDSLQSPISFTNSSLPCSPSGLLWLDIFVKNILCLPSWFSLMSVVTDVVFFLDVIVDRHQSDFKPMRQTRELKSIQVILKRWAGDCGRSIKQDERRRVDTLADFQSVHWDGETNNRLALASLQTDGHFVSHRSWQLRSPLFIDHQIQRWYMKPSLSPIQPTFQRAQHAKREPEKLFV